jgi:hypothetical protein
MDSSYTDINKSLGDKGERWRRSNCIFGDMGILLVDGAIATHGIPISDQFVPHRLQCRACMPEAVALAGCRRGPPRLSVEYCRLSLAEPASPPLSMPGSEGSDGLSRNHPLQKEATPWWSLCR